MLYSAYLTRFFISLLIFPVLMCTTEEENGPNGWCTYNGKALYDGQANKLSVAYFGGKTTNWSNIEPENLDIYDVILLSDCMQYRNGRIEGVEGMFIRFEIYQFVNTPFPSGTYSSYNGREKFGAGNFKMIPVVKPNSSENEIINEVESFYVNWRDPQQTGVYKFEITANLKNGKTLIAYYEGSMY